VSVQKAAGVGSGAEGQRILQHAKQTVLTSS